MALDALRNSYKNDDVDDDGVGPSVGPLNAELNVVDASTDTRRVEDTLLTTEPLHIDGSFDEGGGQIFRNASAYSVLLKRPLNIDHVRLKRDRPGLRPQHLCGLRLLADISGAQAAGLEVGSTSVTFSPKSLKGGEFLADTGTAGSIVLLIQSALPVLLIAPKDSVLTLKGGTHAAMAPQLDYFVDVFCETLFSFGGIPRKSIELSVIRRGYYPKGQGHCLLNVRPSVYRSSTGRRTLSALTIVDRGEPQRILIKTFTSGRYSTGTTFARLEAALRSALALSFPDLSTDPIQKTTDPPNGDDAFGCLLFIETSTGCRIAGSSLGSYKLKPEQVAQSAVAELAKNWAERGCVDEYLQDQLVIFGTLAEGLTRIRCGEITAHTRTAMWVASRVCGVEWTVEPATDVLGTNVISCRGLRLQMHVS
jgi:RNA 3'-terminal phosphate cyclase (ATP)